MNFDLYVITDENIVALYCIQAKLDRREEICIYQNRNVDAYHNMYIKSGPFGKRKITNNITNKVYALYNWIVQVHH